MAKRGLVEYRRMSAVLKGLHPFSKERQEQRETIQSIDRRKGIHSNIHVPLHSLVLLHPTKRPCFHRTIESSRCNLQWLGPLVPDSKVTLQGAVAVNEMLVRRVVLKRQKQRRLYFASTR